MKQLIDEFNIVYPNYAAFHACDYTFEETANINKPHTLQFLTIKGINSFIIPNAIIKDATSIYSNGGSREILRKDNDGIILAEIDGIKYIFICELKSSYVEDNIIKAKDQILGAYIKLHSLFSILQSYNPNEWTIRGIIASYPPSLSKISDLQKCLESRNRKYAYMYNLQRDKKYFMPEQSCKQTFFPLNIPDILLYHLPVPDKTETFTVDFNDIIV